VTLRISEQSSREVIDGYIASNHANRQRPVRDHRSCNTGAQRWWDGVPRLLYRNM